MTYKKVFLLNRIIFSLKNVMCDLVSPSISDIRSFTFFMLKILMNDQALLLKIKKLVALERKTLSEILELLQIVYDKRLFADLGYSSLIKYMVKELGYSESASFRRYQALKLVKDLPETKPMIKDGTLNLSTINSMQSILKTSETKRASLAQIKDKSTKEAEKVFLKILPRTEAPEKKISITENKTRIEVTLENETLEKIDKLKARTKIYDTNKLLDFALECALRKTDLTKKKSRKSQGSTNRRVIPASVKKEVLKRSGEMCEYPGCHERHFLEFDHKIPFSQGGSNEASNIRLYCKSHNQRAAIRVLGERKMRKYLN